jgi:hypothetical protein
VSPVRVDFDELHVEMSLLFILQRSGVLSVGEVGTRAVQRSQEETEDEERVNGGVGNECRTRSGARVAGLCVKLRILTVNSKHVGHVIWFLLPIRLTKDLRMERVCS